MNIKNDSSTIIVTTLETNDDPIITATALHSNAIPATAN